MRAKEFLEQIGRNELIIQNKLAERLYWEELATSSTAKMGGVRVKSSGDHTSMQNQLIEVIAIDSEIQKLKSDISYRISVIQKLKLNEYDLLHKVYIQHMTLKEISVNAGLSYSWATATHKKALNHLQELLDRGA